MSLPKLNRALLSTLMNRDTAGIVADRIEELERKLAEAKSRAPKPLEEQAPKVPFPSDTPRTDAMDLEARPQAWHDSYALAVRLAKTLERELTEARRDSVRLDWRKGPANGGEGTAGTNDEGIPQWYDGDRLLIVIETNKGREVAVVDIDCDEHYFNVKDASSGDAYDAWEPKDWSWWAKLDKGSLPPVEVAGKVAP